MNLNIKIFIVFITIYILSTLRMYFWTKNAYSKDGTLKDHSSTLLDFFFTFCPFVNTIFSIFVVTSFSIDGKENKKLNFDKLFNIKKE